MTARAMFPLLGLAACIVASHAQTPSAHQVGEGSVSSSNSSLIVSHADVPLYPALAKAARLSGTVHVHVSVKGGTVANAEAQSSAAPVLVTAAKENVMTWRFAPDAYGTLDVTYMYELEKEEVLVPENPRIELQLPSLVKIIAKPTKPTPQHGQ
jgi:TonB family protein